MSKTILPLIGAIMAVLMTITLINSVNTNTVLKQEAEEYYLQRVVNNATDSAMLEALTNENVTLNDSEIKPYYLSDTFFRVFLESYGFTVHGEDYSLAYSYVPTLAIVTNDGIIVGYPRQVDNTKIRWQWQPKTPYTYYDAATDTTHFMTINNEGRAMLKPNGKYTDIASEVPILPNKTLLINGTINRVIEQAIMEVNSSNITWDNQFYVPAEITEYSVVNFHGVTLLGIIQNVDFHTIKPVDGHVVGGTQTTRSDKILAYKRNGIKYYSWANDLVGTVNIERIYDTPEQAAIAGYQPDLTSLK